jgi:hypothetical protein
MEQAAGGRVRPLGRRSPNLRRNREVLVRHRSGQLLPDQRGRRARHRRDDLDDPRTAVRLRQPRAGGRRGHHRADRQSAVRLTSAPELLPTPWGTAGQYLPPGASASLLRITAFFHGHGGLHPALVLTAWMAVGVALYLLGEGISQRRSRPSGPMTATEEDQASVAEA